LTNAGKRYRFSGRWPPPLVQYAAGFRRPPHDAVFAIKLANLIAPVFVCGVAPSRGCHKPPLPTSAAGICPGDATAVPWR